MAQLVTGIIGGFQGSSAAKNAAAAQVASGQQAIGVIQSALNQANPLIETAQINTAGDVTGAGGNAAQAVQDAAAAATGRVDTGVTAANALLAPYLTGGAQAFQNLSSLVNAPQQQFQFTQDDPSYQFRLNEGLKALERSAAARSGSGGGAALKAITRYGQDYASTEYQKAFDRFRQTQQDRFAQLSNVAGLGYNAAGQAGGNITAGAQYGGDIGFRGATSAGGFRTNAAQTAADITNRGAALRSQNILGTAGTIADLTTDIGSAKAAGYLGSANAWNGALSSIGRAADSALVGGFGGGKGFSWRGALRGY